MHVSDQQHPQPYGQPPQYAAPAPGAPQQSPQSYAPGAPHGPAQGAHPQHPARGYASVPPATGVRHWAWQLLYWVPMPLVPLLVVPIVLFALRSGAVRNGGVDEANSRAAVNWSLTWLVAVVATGLLHLVMVLLLTSGGPVAGDSPLGGVLAVTATLLGIAYLGGGLLTLINVIRGWSAAGRGEVAEPWLAIRFLRAPRG